MAVIPIEKLDDEISKILSEYKVELGETVELVANKTASSTAKYLRLNAHKRTGKYQKSWTAKRFQGSLVSVGAVVYAKKPYYRLTHLLEHGHASRNGGRVKAYPHIKKAEQLAKEQFFKNLKNSIEKIK